ncbi:40830_t:CDS:1, partial [Gigaspora margarita]
FNVEDFADDQEAGLDDLFDHLDQFIETIHDSISTDKLPPGAILIKHNQNSHRMSVEGIENKVPPDTDFHQWVQEFGRNVTQKKTFGI